MDPHLSIDELVNLHHKLMEELSRLFMLIFSIDYTVFMIILFAIIIIRLFKKLVMIIELKHLFFIVIFLILVFILS